MAVSTDTGGSGSRRPTANNHLGQSGGHSGFDSQPVFFQTESDMSDDKVWTVGTRAAVYHADRSCLEQSQTQGTNVATPRKVTVEQAERRGLRECKRCLADDDQAYRGGNLSKLERILQAQDQQVADD